MMKTSNSQIPQGKSEAKLRIATVFLIGLVILLVVRNDFASVPDNKEGQSRTKLSARTQSSAHDEYIVPAEKENHSEETAIALISRDNDKEITHNKNPQYPPPELQFLPNTIILWDTTFTNYLFIADKSAQKLHLYQFDSTLRLIKSFDCTTGQNWGDKKRAGDKKTPEGIYFFTRCYGRGDIPELVGSGEYPKYGEMVFTMDFPNELDSRNGIRGNGIWLHGTDEENRHLKEFDTMGCVVVSNTDIVELSDYIRLRYTPIIIVSELNYQIREDIVALRDIVIETIHGWRNAWQDRDIPNYISYYHKNFYSNGKNRRSLQRYKTSIFSRYHNINITIKNLCAFRHGDYILVLFTQVYHDSRAYELHDTGLKRLYLARQGRQWKILSETWKAVYEKGVL